MGSPHGLMISAAMSSAPSVSSVSVHTVAFGHPKDKRVNKKGIIKQWYGVPESGIRIYLPTYPNCAPGQRALNKSNMNPLKNDFFFQCW